MDIVEVERRNRIRLSVAAYAYELRDDSIMTDSEFDNLADMVNVQVVTGNEVMDDFFREHFEPYTGQWIHKHPHKNGLERIYNSVFLKRNRSDGHH
tara:strand:+ start:1449 stop:1736 length:288 start_codon:yes stop_codon:yes gene_type:complete